MEIRILPSNNSQQEFRPEIGAKTNDLFSRFSSFLDDDELDSLLNETNHILSHCTNPKLLIEQDVTHLTVGYVQSGKTMSFTSLTALAADNGYRIIIYLAGTKNNLLNQTTKRLTKDLISDSSLNNAYKVFENPTESKIQEMRNKLRLSSKPTLLITILKHYDHINRLANIFRSLIIKNELGKQGVLIIDDEADQASLNGFTYINGKNANTSSEWDEETDNKESSTYASIINLKAAIPNHSYVQYTATPQGPLLISIIDLLSPKSHTVLTPGKKYTGGKTYFKDFPDLVINIPNEEVYHYRANPLSDVPNSLKESLQVYILSVALVTNYWNKVKFLSMMIHADRQKDVSRLFHGWVSELIEKWTTILNLEIGDLGRIDLDREFKEVYEREAIKFYSSQDDVPSFDEIKPLIADAINDTQINLIISDVDATNTIDWESSSSHILVGADMLNRGFTVENLAITYMPRYTKSKSNADTIQQRCRFFGYKQKYLKSCRVYLPSSSIIEYVDYLEHEEEMRTWLKNNNSLENIERQLMLAEKLNVTRKNILPYNIVQTKMKGWHSMNALNSIESNMNVVSSFLDNNPFELLEPQYNTIDRNHKIATVPVENAIDFLTKFKFGNFADTARKQATIRYLQYLSSESDLKISNVHFIQMAYESNSRLRNFDPNTLKIDQLFTGRSTAGTEVYPGDREIKREDSICIQLHKVKLSSNQINRLNGKVIYTIAIYYPEDFATRYTSIEPEDFNFEDED
ncbi:Z1 domain-containing protein [Chryseobacterium cucumeris]|uniref:Z1 domain-containing protein n=1 Tax=Chryseobacterium cucumeris TaxID=1813611 RepID=UPI001F4B8BFD|nr:Z1 domain-containing protein [Chryseobacterium cucumeris]